MACVANRLANRCQIGDPSLGLRQLRLARLPRMGFTMAHEGLDRHRRYLLGLFHTDLLKSNAVNLKNEGNV